MWEFIYKTLLLSSKRTLGNKVICCRCYKDMGTSSYRTILLHPSIPPAPTPPPPPLPPRATARYLPALSVSEVGHLQILLCPGSGICQPRGHSRAFDTHAVSYQNITTQRVLLEKKQIDSSVKDRNKLKRVVKACSQFYACISLLLMKSNLHSEIGAIDVNQRFLLLNQISVDIKLRTSFHMYKTIHNV